MNIMLCALYVIEFPLFKELTRAIQASFTPEPITVVLDAVVDAKGWMADQTPALHDHLKAHQFKFERKEVGVSDVL